MSSVPATLASAWDLWSKGLIAATNIEYVGVNASADRSILANLTIKRGHNAIRLFLSGYADEFSIYDADITAIANAPNGWDSTQLLSTANGNTAKTIASVGAQIQKILSLCYKYRIGVIMTVKYGGDALWSATDDTLRQNLSKFWQQTYNKFGGQMAVIGFDLLNEPNPAIDGIKLSDIQSAPNHWPQLAQKLVTDIRNWEATNGIGIPLPLVVEGIYSGQSRGLAVFDSSSFTKATGPFIKDPKNRIVYSFHFYDPANLTHQGIYMPEEIGITYPLPGVVQRSFWFGDQPKYELREFKSTSDVQSAIQIATDFKTKFDVPVFVGEFSIAEPDIDQVYPQLSPSRSQAFPSQRVSEIQNTVNWEAPVLETLTKIRSQTDFDAFYNGLTQSEKDSFKSLFERTNRRWITRLVAGTDGYATAYLDHINTGDPLGTGFMIYSSPKTLAALTTEFGLPTDKPNSLTVGYGSQWAEAGSPMNSQFYNEPKVKIIASSGSVGAAFNMTAGAQTRLVRHEYSFRVPTTVSPTTVDGVSVTVPGMSSALKMPVALLWVSPAKTPAVMGQSRLDYARDTIKVWQDNGFSWSWYGDDVNSAAGMIAWRPSKQISELLTSATGSLRLSSRA